MAEVLIISKPLVAPWTDGSKNLARDLVRHAPNTDFETAPGPGGQWKARALARLARPDRSKLLHFFFAPNPKTNRILRAMLAVRLRRAPVVHTVCSAPTGGVQTWFADVHVALTQHTADALEAAGAPNVRVIPPGVPVQHVATAAGAVRRQLGLPPGPVVLFAGDLAPGGGAEVMADALERLPGVHAAFACRPKGEGHVARQARLKQRLGTRATWLGLVEDMPSLLAACDVQCLPATDLTAKVDLPLICLEGLAVGRPVVVSRIGPLDELQAPGVHHVAPEGAAVAEALKRVLAAPGPVELPEQYTARGMATRYRALYDELLSKDKRE